MGLMTPKTDPRQGPARGGPESRHPAKKIRLSRNPAKRNRLSRNPARKIFKSRAFADDVVLLQNLKQFL